LSLVLLILPHFEDEDSRPSAQAVAAMLEHRLLDGTATKVEYDSQGNL